MVGVGVAPPSAARLAARGVRARRVSAKRSWPPGCGRFPALPPPPEPEVAGDGEKGADGRADEVVAPTAVPPAAQNGAPHEPGEDKVEMPASSAAVSPTEAQNNSIPVQQGQNKAEEVVALVAVSSVERNGILQHPAPQQGPEQMEEEGDGGENGEVGLLFNLTNTASLDDQGEDKVEVPTSSATVSPTEAQNDSIPVLQGQNKAEESVAVASVSSVERNDILQHPAPQQGPEQVEEEGDRGENGEVGVLFNVTDTASLDGEEGNRTVQVAAPVVGVPESDIVGASGSAHNGSEGAGLLLVAESGHAVRDEAAGDAVGREIGNRTGGGELQGKVDGVEGSRKRWLTSALNPPPKRRAVSAVRRFPPGCGRAAVATGGSGVSEVPATNSFPPGGERPAVTTDDDNGVLEVSPVRVFPAGCGRAAVPTDDIAVLEVSPIRAYPSGCERPAVATVESRDEDRTQLGATKISNCDASVTEALTALPDSGGAANEKVDGKRVVEKGSTKGHTKNQESQIASDTSRADAVTKASTIHGFTKKMKGDISRREGKQVSQVPGDDKVSSKLDGSLQKEVSKAPMSHSIDANTKGKRFNGDKMNLMQKKTLSAKKKLMPSKAIVKIDKFAHDPKVDDTGNNISQPSTVSKYGKQITSSRIEENDDMDLVPNRIIVQALMAPDKCPWTQGRKSIASASKSRAPRKKLKGKKSPPRKQLSWEVVSSELGNDENIDDNEDSLQEDDDNSRALVVYGENKETIEFNVNLIPSVPSSSHHGHSGDNDIDDRRKVRKLLQKFQAVCRKLMQLQEQRLRNIARIDYEAISIIKKDPMYTKLGAIVGNVPGVEVGDEFHFRVELSLVGLHRPYQGGIDTSKVNGIMVATCIVASGGYPDELPNSDELIYTGSGGKACGKKEAEDQKLERGNLALKNCIETKTPVRVIHGFKGQSGGEAAHSKGKQVSTFIYDGLYNVVACWQEGPKGSMVYKYKLLRIPGQPQLALHEVKMTKKSKVREGLLLPDISHGSERIPICVINTIDVLRPAPFKYVTKIIYPSWYKKEPPAGCDCINGCSDNVKCACVVKNGGEIPYTSDGAIVEVKPLIYECGPSCRCPPTCHNRVSQHGIKIPLEIFKTGNTGWGVRSLSSISSGSFICEYAGELLQDEEAEKRDNDEYLFDIGHNYHDEELWEGLKSIPVPGLGSSTSSSNTMEGFTIDAAECGNVGRFINHSCSPNLYAQNVLWDHDDVQKPHVMLFAVENIPPLQELTYHYNYAIGHVRDKNGGEKVKHCYCGSSECCGRLY